MASSSIFLIDPVPSDRDRAARKFLFPDDSRAWLVPLALGAVLLALSLLALVMGAGQRWLYAYLVGWTFCTSIAIGSLFFVMIQHVVKARWVTVVRRIPEMLAANLPLLFVLGLPLAVSPFFTYSLYHWADPSLYIPSDPHYDALVAGKEAYLNAPFFLIRYVVYGLIFSFFANKVYSLSLRQDVEPNPQNTLDLRKFSAIGIPLAAVSTAFLGFDMLMSLDPHWFSTMFGVYFFAGGWVANLALIAFLAMTFQKMGLLRHEITEEHYHDLGKLTFGFTVFWTYIAFSQYFLIWYSNIPEEVIWFQKRVTGGWGMMSLALFLGHFIVPFLVLLPRFTKRLKPVFAFICGWILVMHFIDHWWLSIPTIHISDYAAEGHAALAGAVPAVQTALAAAAAGSGDSLLHVYPAYFSWVDFACWLGMFGLFIGVTFFRASRHAVTPYNDPYYNDSLHFHNV